MKIKKIELLTYTEHDDGTLEPVLKINDKVVFDYKISFKKDLYVPDFLMGDFDNTVNYEVIKSDDETLYESGYKKLFSDFRFLSALLRDKIIYVDNK